MSALTARPEPASLEELPHEDFVFFRELIFRLAGISLGDKKKDLVRARLRSHLYNLGLKSFAEYRVQLENGAADNPELQAFVNLLTTNKTSFFREPEHFDYVAEKLIPEWKAQGKRSVHAWSCATATGEEPYTIAMVLQRHLPPGMSYKILATDIDTNVLAKARNGVYDAAEMGDIPAEYRSEFAELGARSAAGWMRMPDEIHKNISFQNHNLTKDLIPVSEPFDLIFCRNVLIYFSQETIKVLVEKLHSVLAPGGTLIVGHSESIHGAGRLFKTVKPSIFRKI